MNINELAAKVHLANIKWWQNPETQEPISRNKGELLMLMISEVAEAMEGERKDLMDDKLPHRKMAEVEIADVFIRGLDFAGGFGIEPELFDMVSLPSNKGEALIQICCQITNAYTASGDRVSYYLSRVLSMCVKYSEQFGYDLYGAMEEKMAYNATREDHKHEARLIAGGKQF